MQEVCFGSPRASICSLEQKRAGRVRRRSSQNTHQIVSGEMTCLSEPMGDPMLNIKVIWLSCIRYMLVGGYSDRVLSLHGRPMEEVDESRLFWEEEGAVSCGEATAEL